LSNLPDLLILGPPRTGTTALYNYLTEHNQVEDRRQDSEVELQYFTAYYDRGPDWYKSHFYATPQLSLEATTQYSYNPAVPKKVADLLPDVKLIQLNRNRVDRAWSHFCMHRSNTDYVEGRSLEEYVSTDRGKYIIENSVYRPQAQRWLDYFHKDQFLIINSEKMFADPDEVYNEVLDFLGLQGYHLDSYPKCNAIDKPKIPRPTRMFLLDRYDKLDEEHRQFIGDNELNYIGWLKCKSSF